MSVTWLQTIAMFGLAMLMIAAGACSSDGKAPTHTAVVPRESVTDLATVAPTGTPEVSLGTGIASIDNAVAAAASHDLDALMQQVRYSKQPCVAPAERMGEGGRPTCRLGEATGDLVDGFLVAQCSGGFARSGDAEAIRTALAYYFRGPVHFFGAYQTPTAWGAGKYTAIFADAPGFGGLAVVEILDDFGLVGVGTGCGNSPEQLAGSWTPIASR